jgi:hypothetical protein
MARVTYYDGEDFTAHGRWEGALKASLNSKRGQAALRKLREALLALPEKRLIANSLSDEGQVCALGALAAYEYGKATGKTWIEAIDDIDNGEGDYMPETIRVVQDLGFSYTLAWTIAEENDREVWSFKGGVVTAETPEQRYEYMLAWVERRIIGLERIANA